MSLSATQTAGHSGESTPVISILDHATHQDAARSDVPKGKATDPMAILWAVMEKVGGGERDHLRLEEGGRHEIELQLSGHVDGRWLNERVSATATIGHDQTKSTSATPQLPHLVAYILSKLNGQTRARILRDLPNEFAENDCVLPEAEEACVLQSSELLRKLRSKKQIRARRPVRCQYRVGGNSNAATA